MHINKKIFNELLKRGYSVKKRRRVWDISDSRLWYVTPELSKGYLSLRKFGPYRARVIQDETELIKKYAGDILKQFGFKRFNLIDLGCGDGEKAEVFIKSLPKDARLRYCPIDINEHFVNVAKKKIRAMNSQKVNGVKPFVADFLDSDYVISLLRSNDYQNNISLLLGETISHYDIHDLLFKISNNMFRGDFLVIGNGMRKGKRFVQLEKYRNPLFNEWFINIMRALGFKDNEVEVDVRFTKERLEGFYHILVDKKIQNNGKKVFFRSGDEVVVATQYKYFERELRKYCKMYFSSVQLCKTKDDEYCLILCKK